MPPTRSRAGGLAAALSIALAATLTAPALAADSPEAAVNELIDAVTSGDFSAIDTLVCEAERDAVRAQLDPSEAMGVGGDDFPISFRIEDRAVELVSEDGDTATLMLTGTMSIDVATEDIEAVALEMLEAEMGELSDEDIEAMLPFMEMAFSQTSPIDEEITAEREDGEWLVCGGLGEAPADDFASGDDFAEVSNVSSEGVCGLVTPEELTAAGMLEYDSSSGWELADCTYTTSDWEAYHSANVSVQLDTDAEYAASAYGSDQEIEVAGTRAFVSESGNTPLFVEVGPDMMSVSVWPPDPLPEGYDAMEQSLAVAELFVARIPEARESLIPPVLPLLCSLDFAGDYEAAIGLPMHSGSVTSDYCNFESRDSAYVNVSLRDGTLDDSIMFSPDAEETTVAGLRAIEVGDEYNESNFEVRVELSDEQTLYVTVQPYNHEKALDVPALEIAELLTQHIVDKQAE